MRTTYTNWNALPLILTTTQAALLLQITPDRIAYLCKTGAIPAAQVGKGWRIDRDVIRERLKGATP